MGKRRKRADFEDDGRVIAPMNVEGMPWHAPRSQSSESGSGAPLTLTREEQRAVTAGIMKAALLVAGIFVVVLLGFILFCIFVWFR